VLSERGSCFAGVEDVDGESERGETVRSFQLISGFIFSNQGIPRIMECIPIGATRKVMFWGTPAIAILKVTCRLECIRVVPSASETRTGGQGCVFIRREEMTDSWMKFNEAPESISAWSTEDKAVRETGRWIGSDL
jgi:hypothetical protein